MNNSGKNIKLIYFASVREAIGLSEEQWITQAQTVLELRKELIERGSPYAEGLAAQKVLRYGVNQYMVDGNALIKDGDDVAFFPPVTGG